MPAMLDDVQSRSTINTATPASPSATIPRLVIDGTGAGVKNAGNLGR